MAPNSRFVLSLGMLLGGLLLVGGLAACSKPAPLTRDYRDEEEDDLARKDYYETAALTYYEGGRYDDSILMWRKVLSVEPNNQKAKWGLARALMGKRDPVSLRESEDILVSIINLDWKHPELGDRTFELKRDLANVYGTLADYYERDIRTLDDKLTNDPNAEGETLRRQLATQRRRRDALVRKAVPIYRDVLRDSPDNQYALAGLAKAHLMLGEETQGIEYAQRYIRLARTSREGWKREMRNWSERTGGKLTQRQRKHFRDKIYGTVQKEKNVTLMMGSVYMRREEFGSAVAMYSRVLDMDDGEIAAYVERAQAYAGLGQYQMAVNDIEEYLKFTDPEMHRQQRVKAGMLLQTYQRIVSQPRSMNPGQGPGGFPATRPAPTPYRAAPAPTPYRAAPAPTPYRPTPSPTPYNPAAPAAAPLPAGGFPAPAAPRPDPDLGMLPGAAPMPAAHSPAVPVPAAPVPAAPVPDPDLAGFPGIAPAPAPAPAPAAASFPQLPPNPAPIPRGNPAPRDDGVGPPPAGAPRRR